MQHLTSRQKNSEHPPRLFLLSVMAESDCEVNQLNLEQAAEYIINYTVIIVKAGCLLQSA